MKLKKQEPLERGAGILLPVFSLPSPYGIGTFGKAAYDFIDYMKSAGQKYWQVLPLGPTGYGDSPYQSFSAFAGNPYFIDLDLLVQDNLLSKSDVADSFWGDSDRYIDYGNLYTVRFRVLRKAFANSKHKDTVEYKNFCQQNNTWLFDYCLYMAIKEEQGGASWLEWGDDFRLREPNAIALAKERLSEEIDFWSFCQFKFYSQWLAVKEYANNNGIQIIGDIPIYVSMDSADVWVNGQLFQLDEKGHPIAVAGVPPDMFSATGQLWGNPLYDWDTMEQDGFAWWQQRMSANAMLYDVIRIDHFIGIVNYYSIPAQDDTAMNGEWKKGPAEKLIAAITPALHGKKIIAEDLGVVTPPVRELLKKSGYPGMKLMQFAFDGGNDNHFLPCHFDKNMVIYGGTHDNETLVGFFANQKRKVLSYAKDYLRVRKNSDIPWALILTGYESSANIAVYQMQDLLLLNNEARMNTPSTLGNNWKWRLCQGELNPGLAKQLLHLMDVYGR